MELTLSSQIIKELVKTGYRVTPARKAIIEQITDKQHLLSAGDLIKQLKFLKVTVNKTTVYRELAFLLAKGIIREVHTKQSVVSYEAAALPHHHHLICQKCGVMLPITSSNLEVSLDCLMQELQTNGFKVTDHMVELYGVCASCR